MTKQKLTGIVPPLITPLSDRDTLDVGGVERLMEHVIAGGVSGVFVLGTTGEAPSLSYRLRREVIDRAAKVVAHRVQLLVGVSDTSAVETISLTKHAADAGADAVVLAPPYYYNVSQAELLEYLQRVAPHLALPVYIYNIPSLTKVAWEQDTVQRALEIKNVIGLKDSSQNILYFNRVREMTASREDFSMLVGPEEMLAQTALLGGDGGVCGGANIFPRMYVDLFNSARAGDVARARQLHKRVLHFSSTMYQANRQNSAIIKGLKAGLRSLGVCDDVTAEPFDRLP
jgi:dihydrodipicolinate synthase/N-acetylneuraminate lyase